MEKNPRTRGAEQGSLIPLDIWHRLCPTMPQLCPYADTGRYRLRFRGTSPSRWAVPATTIHVEGETSRGLRCDSFDDLDLTAASIRAWDRHAIKLVVRPYLGQMLRAA
jgi:hypothetical protein